MPSQTAKNSKASQDFVPIKEVRDGIVILHDGSMRAILMASSINFALKGEDEQQAVVMLFQSFLNSLDFPVQISIQSRDLDIRPYIATLDEALKNTIDDLMRIQIREYIQFIKSFTEGANIMAKHFFVVVPYSPAQIKVSSGIASILPWKTTKKQKTTGTTDEFEENLSQLEQRISVVQQGLIRSGVRTVQMGTEETIELFYKIFNPGEQNKPMQIN